MRNSDLTEWLSPEQLAKELGVPLSTIYQWRYKGTGPKAHRFGRHIRFRRSDVDEWIEGRADVRISEGR